MLKRAVDSVLEQSFRDFEFLICDDGSSHEAMEYLNQAAARDIRICLIRPGNKLDLAAKLNVCLDAANGEYIGRMDDDDYSYPDRFEKQLAVLETDQAIGFVGCNVELRKKGKTVGTRTLPLYPAVKDYYIVQPYIHPALLFRREALCAVNGYSEKTAQVLCEDYDLLLRLHREGYLGKNIQEVLLAYTVPESAKGSRTMRHRLNETITRFCRYKDLGILPKALPYVVKPVLTGLLPEKTLMMIKRKYYGR